MDEEDDEQMELEAAQALAAISQPSLLFSSLLHDPAIASCGCTSNTVAEYKATVHTAAGYLSKAKLNQSSNKAEQQARKLRRIIANRESARETIRRRKAMYIELTRKAADVLEENQTLKHEKEQAVAARNVLKDKNMFFKTQLAKVTNAETKIRQEETRSSHGETYTPITNNPLLYLNNQPSLVPCFLSSVIPQSDIFMFHRPDIMSSSPFLMPHMDTPPCSHQEHDNPMAPIFILPVPWILPFLCQTTMSQTTMFPTNDQRSNHTYSSLPQQHNDVASNQILGTEASEGGGYVHGDESTVSPEANASCPTERLVGSLSYGERERIVCLKKQEDVFAATEARRRRKELMKLKK